MTVTGQPVKALRAFWSCTVGKRTVHLVCRFCLMPTDCVLDIPEPLELELLQDIRWCMQSAFWLWWLEIQRYLYIPVFQTWTKETKWEEVITAHEIRPSSQRRLFWVLSLIQKVFLFLRWVYPGFRETFLLFGLFCECIMFPLLSCIA